MFQQLRLKWLPGLMLGLAVNGAWAQQPAPRLQVPPYPSSTLSRQHGHASLKRCRSRLNRKRRKRAATVPTVGLSNRPP